MEQKQRYEIETCESLETLQEELDEAVALGKYSTPDYQGIKTHVITRSSCSLSVSFLKRCFGRD